MQTSVGPLIYFSDSERTAISGLEYFIWITIITLPICYFFMQFILNESLNMFWAIYDSFQIYYLILFVDTVFFDNIKNVIK